VGCWGAVITIADDRRRSRRGGGVRRAEGQQMSKEEEVEQRWIMESRTKPSRVRAVHNHTTF
jgi:hypothetical protein